MKKMMRISSQMVSYKRWKWICSCWTNDQLVYPRRFWMCKFLDMKNHFENDECKFFAILNMLHRLYFCLKILSVWSGPLSINQSIACWTSMSLPYAVRHLSNAVGILQLEFCNIYYNNAVIYVKCRWDFELTGKLWAVLLQVQWDAIISWSNILWWLSARLQYLQCVSNGDTAVLH